jgi:hypothetical protein
MSLDFLKDATNVVLVGPNGVGKSTLARNIAHKALIHGHTVLFTSAGQLLGDLASLDSDSALRRRLHTSERRCKAMVGARRRLRSSARLNHPSAKSGLIVSPCSSSPARHPRKFPPRSRTSRPRPTRWRAGGPGSPPGRPAGPGRHGGSQDCSRPSASPPRPRWRAGRSPQPR